MANQLTAGQHADRVLVAQDQLILRIQHVANEAVAAIRSDNPRSIENHLEKLRQHRLIWNADNEQFFSTIEFALEQLGLKPAT